MVKSKKTLWIVRSCFVAITIAVFILSYYYYSAHYYPFSYLDQQWGQVLLYGGTLLGITIFTWIFPVPGSIIAIIYGLIRIAFGTSLGRSLSIPSGIHYLIYGIFLVAAIAYLIIGLKQELTRVHYVPNKTILRAVRIITIAALVIFVFVYTVVYLEWWVLFAIPALLTLGIAWIFPTAGGLLMLLVGIPAFYNLYDSNYDFQIKLPAYILGLIFIASGFMHIAASFRWKRGKIKQDD